MVESQNSGCTTVEVMEKINLLYKLKQQIHSHRIKYGMVIILALWKMALEQQKEWILFALLAVSSWNIQRLLLTRIAKLTPAIDELSVSIYLSMPKTKTNLVRGRFWWELQNYLIYYHFDCANKIQIELCRVIPQTVLYSVHSEKRNLKQKTVQRKQS